MGNYNYMRIIGKNIKTKEWEVVEDFYIGDGYHTHFGSDLLPSIKTFDVIQDLDLSLVNQVGNGRHYNITGIVDSSSFETIIKETLENYSASKIKEDILNKYFNSAEYFKLSDEEKSNVMSEQIGQDYFRELEGALETYNGLKFVLKLYENCLKYEDFSVYGLIYNGQNIDYS